MNEQDKPAGALVPAAGPQSGQLVPDGWLPNRGPSGYVTKIDQSGADGKALVFRLMTETGRKPEDVLNMPIRVTNYLLSPAQFVDKESGEDVATVVTRLVLDDGAWVETHSVGVLKTLGLLVSQFGDPPWPKGVGVTLRRKPLRDGRSWIVIELTPEPKKGK